jgi:superfamily II DNA helicase RecQ
VQIKMWTLPFLADAGVFDTRPLEAFVNDRCVFDCQFHVVTAEGRPYIVCMVIAEPLDDPDEEIENAAVNGRAARREAAAHLVAGLSEDDRALYDRMRGWRAGRAVLASVPPYRILTNRELAALVRTRPGDLGALQACTGLGEQRLERFGAEILSALAACELELTAPASGVTPRVPAPTPPAKAPTG